MDLIYYVGLLIKSHLRVTEYVSQIIILVIEWFKVWVMYKINSGGKRRLDCGKTTVKSER